jgi:hypothetical protein
MRVLITTTINVPYGLANWRRAGFDPDDIFVVAGDQKSPHDKIASFLDELPGKNIYLHPNEQERQFPHTSKACGWNCIQRRNLALLFAMTLDPEWIITIDDDNFPIDMGHAALVTDYLSGANDDYKIVRSERGWFNVGQLLEPPVTVRGYPLSERHVLNNTVGYTGIRDIGVVASLWLGAPDIDAIERMVNNPWVHDGPNVPVVLERGTWCPFNSQATAYRANLAHLMPVWPGIGRYDDIFGSFAARAVMDELHEHVLYGPPLVHQDRNPHDLMQDLLKEVDGMAMTDELIAALRDARPSNLHMAFTAVRPFVHDDTANFFDAWLEDLHIIGKGQD